MSRHGSPVNRSLWLNAARTARAKRGLASVVSPAIVPGMARCDKTSADPDQHAGPFEPLQIFEGSGRRESAEKCLGCGNTVIRLLPQEAESETLPDNPS